MVEARVYELGLGSSGFTAPCNDKMLSFVELQAKDVSSAVHTRNVQFLLAKMSKVYQDMFTELLRELFWFREILYGLKHPSHFAVFIRTIGS